jgi:ERCC4-related helicase
MELNQLIKLATTELDRFLSKNLPNLGVDWWQKHVIDRLSFQQQRHARERDYKILSDLDFAALLRVLDQNWFELSTELNLPKEVRNWVKELQTVRNKWAHQSAKEIPTSEIYRDADTLSRVLNALGSTSDVLSHIEAVKANALSHLATITSNDERPTNAEKSQDKSLFAIGNLVSLRSNPTIIVPIIDVLEAISGERRYRVFQNNTKIIYYESQLQALAVKEEGQCRVTIEVLHALLTSHQLLAPATASLFSLRSGRVKFIPYQYRPVLKLIRADRPRLLIADEVGVGKTIEAGLIIKELSARMDLSSILIICPKPLVSERKWFLEMKRFGEDFTAMDGQLLRHCLHETHLEGEWPEKYSKALVPFSLFDSDLVRGPSGGRKSKNQGLINLDPPPKFDLVIVDEAHHIRNSETFLHQAVRYFCDHAEAVIFLTATPIQLGSRDLYTLLNALRPDLVIDQASFEQMAEPNHFINTAIHQCRLGEVGWALEARKQLSDAAQTEWGRLFLRESPSFQKTYDRLQEVTLDDSDRVELIGAIEGFYTFGSLINRTRRRDVGEFTTRKPETLTIDFTLSQKALHERLLEIIANILAFCHGNQNVKFMMTTIRRQAASCLYGLAPLLKAILSGKLNQLEFMESNGGDTIDFRFLDQVRGEIAVLLKMADDLDPHDPKIEAFLKVIKNKQVRENNKILIFSTFRHTLSYLTRHSEQAGLRYGLVHGDVPDEERTDLRRRFRLPKDDPHALDILLSSEVGCEGLDFEFCDFLINYDLPWNPMRIEQRIGRIDRYGQKSQTIAIVNFITPGTVDAEIYERCLWRIGVFQSAIGGNEEILGEITKELQDIAESFDLTHEEREKRLKQLSDNSIRQIQEEQALEKKQAELLGLAIPNHQWKKDIESADSYWLSSTALQRCVSLYLGERLNTDQEYLLGEKTLKTLRLSQEARGRLLEDFKRLPRSAGPVVREWEKWLKGEQPVVPVTFDQEAAAENTKALHLSVSHPLVRQAAQYFIVDEPVYAALEVQSEVVQPGEYQFGVYQWTKQGVKQEAMLVPVASDPSIEEELFSLIQFATTREDSELLLNSEFDELDAQHHSKWVKARADHIAENRQYVDYRMQNLTVSHKARCKAIEDQLHRTVNDKIRLMKQSELGRANMDFNRRMQELEWAAEGGDIFATPVLFGTINIRG